eukprot:6558152-Karenia_brevis.AAC.1
MLRDESEAREARLRAGTHRVHNDPKLFESPKTYARFLRQLEDRGMLTYKIASEHEDGVLGVFFVRKKNGDLRIIFDTRALNCAFKEPPSTILPSAASFASLETDPGRDFYFGSADLSNCFYSFEVPESMSEYFTLPPIYAGLVGKNFLQGTHVSAGQRLLPHLTVLPMGFSLSLHLAQLVLRHGLSQSVPESCIIEDRKPGVSL